MQTADAPAAPQVGGLLQGRRRVALAVLATLAALVAVLPSAVSGTTPVSAGSQTRDTSPPPLPPPPPRPRVPPTPPVRHVGPGTPAGDSRVVDLVVGTQPRAYVLVPALGLPPGTPASLLVVLHQDVGSARAVTVGLGLDDLRKSGVALAYPAGVGGSWNAGGCCGIALKRDVDDVGFVNAVLDDVGTRTPIDPSRRALLGYSGGGMLAYRLLCGPHPPLVAAVEVGGSLESPCDDVHLPDLLAVHGEKDGSIGLSTPVYVTHLRMSPRPVVSTLTTVAGLAGCHDRRTSEVNGIQLWRWPDCRSGTTVTAQIVPGAGHGWADVGGAARATGFLLPRLAVTG